MVAIVDYGVGNLRSVEKAVKRVGYDCLITGDRKELQRSSALILPGVGNFRQAAGNLKRNGLDEFLTEMVKGEGRPVLGICLGMQLMTLFSEEGNCEGFGWISAETRLFRLSDHKVPHIGWNTVEVNKRTDPEIIPDPADEFYFVHSYFVSCQNREDILFTTRYEVSFTSGFLRGNIMGVQFHPEKSHLSGLKILKYFFAVQNVQA